MFIHELQSMIESSDMRGIFIGEEFMDILLLLYADDLCIFDDTVIGLQRKIDILSNFCKKWGLEINMSKTEILVFRRGGTLRYDERWFLNDKRINVSTYYSYLGVLFSNRLSWTKCIDTLKIKANKALFAIKQLQFHFVNMPVNNILFKLFNIKIKPILLYGAEICGCKGSQIVETFHTKFCKFVLGVGKYVSSTAILAECGRNGLHVDYHMKCVKYWCKLIRMNDERYPRQCYLLMKKLDECGRITWATHVKYLLDIYGFGNVWFEQNIGDVKCFLQLFRQRLLDCNKQSIQIKIYESRKLRYYSHVKILLDMEYYVTAFRNRDHRRMMCLLRLSELPIRSNLGRREDIDSSQRFCRLCNNGCIEDEVHFVFVCPFYATLRQKYIPVRFYNNPCIKTFSNLLNSKNDCILRNVAKYVKEALLLRTES
ncbi:uncharacterized protein [Haliotis cracherodii]|uniref:uncharacterized protein n=1 Tax=Haliotis cracherodii TaxID=6455 RepID=UPI0039E8A157